MISWTIILNFFFPFYYFSLNSSVSFVFHHEYTTILIHSSMYAIMKQNKKNKTKRTKQTVLLLLRKEPRIRNDDGILLARINNLFSVTCLHMLNRKGI